MARARQPAAAALMGYLLVLLLAALLFGGLLWRARPSTSAAKAIALTLILAGVGYVWQGRPFQPGSPAAARPARAMADPLFEGERMRWLGAVGPEADLLASADRLIASGSPDYAVGVLKGAVTRSPDDMGLWIGLGHALAAYAEGTVTPAARFCYERAAQIAPDHPAPRYFLGLALLTAGDVDGAEGMWRPLLAALPPNGDYHRLLEQRLALIDRLRAATRPAQPPASN